MARVMRKTWICDECGKQFRTWADEEPVCPNCAVASEIRKQVALAVSAIPAPAIMGDRTKIQDHVTREIMSDMGMTNMRDNQRAGDIAAPPLDPALVRRVNDTGGFWRQTGINPAAVAGSMIPDGHAGVPKGEAMAKMQRIAQKIESGR